MKRLCIILAALMLLFIPRSIPASASYAYGHDNSTAVHNWTHGDPNLGLPPKGNGYYYLKAYAAGSNVFCEVYSGGYWNLRLEDGNKNVLAAANFSGTGGRVYITNAKPGKLYMCRLENDGAYPEKDYLELNSGVTGDTLTSDCGGPGPVWDVNFNAPPMEPLHTNGMPVNGCNDIPGSLEYDATDPRVGMPPNQQSYDLGVNRGNATYTIQTTRYADLTAFVFFGSQGKSATMTITDDSGNIVNGPKWGAQEANPRTMNQEYVGVDAGQVPPGVYHIRFIGPDNSQHLWAISGNV